MNLPLLSSSLLSLALVPLAAAQDPVKAPPFSTPTPRPTAGRGAVTYKFHQPKDPSPEDAAILKQMTDGLDRATRCYSENAEGIRHHVDVFYSPGTPTADGSSNGAIRLGRNSRNQRVCMHEIAHTLGVGTSPAWGKLVVGGVFTGKNATKALQEVTKDDKAILHADRMHFWPYGLNYDNEVKSDADFVAHCRIVAAIVKDLKRAR
jgi:hypothetical protein